MSRFRLLFLGLFAVLAVSAGASAAASALVYLVGNMEVLAGEKFLTLSAQLTNALLKLTGANVEITCKKTLDTGFIEAGGKSSASILFEECTVGKPSTTCKITEPIHFEVHGQLVTEEGKTLDSFVPASGKTFTTLHFTNCSLSTIEVEGMLRASVVALTMQLKNTLKFTNNAPAGLLNGAGSNMTFTLEEDVWLENDENWGVID
jgi:hypothetical protein